VHLRLWPPGTSSPRLQSSCCWLLLYPAAAPFQCLNCAVSGRRRALCLHTGLATSPAAGCAGGSTAACARARRGRCLRCARAGRAVCSGHQAPRTSLSPGAAAAAPDGGQLGTSHAPARGARRARRQLRPTRPQTSGTTQQTRRARAARQTLRRRAGQLLQRGTGSTRARRSRLRRRQGTPARSAAPARRRPRRRRSRTRPSLRRSSARRG